MPPASFLVQLQCPLTSANTFCFRWKSFSKTPSRYHLDFSLCYWPDNEC